MSQAQQNGPLSIQLPGGRIVMGDPTSRQERDNQGRPLDKPRWFVGLAVDKSAPGMTEILQTIMQCAWQGYQAHPGIQQRINAGLAAGFSWKIEDGDNPNDPKNRGREGWAGCWIFKLSTTLGVIACCDINNVPIEPSSVKCGHYADTLITVKPNGLTDNNAGLYLSPVWVRFLGYGPEITYKPNPMQAFGNRPGVMPAGASSTPITPSYAAQGSGAWPGGAPPQQQQGFGGQSAGMPPQQQQGFGGQPAGMPPQQQQGFGGQPAGAPPQQGFPAGGQGAGAAGGQAPGGNPAPMSGAPGFQGTASPSSPQAQVANAYPGAAPIPGWGNPAGQ